MTSNPEPIVQQLQHDVQNLLAYVMGPDARSQTAYTVEVPLFRRLLAVWLKNSAERHAASR